MEKIIYPTVTTAWYKPTHILRERWRKKYGRERFTFEEARRVQSFPDYWSFPYQKNIKWKWIAEAFPPRVAEYLFRKHVSGSNLVLLDLFSGIGGWSLGAYWSGKITKTIMVEKDVRKCTYLKLNFKKLGIEYKVVCNDVQSVDYKKLGKIDVVTTSPPCEDLSKLRFLNKYGSRLVRGTVPLTRFSIEIVDMLKPRIAFYENVYRKSLRKLLENEGWKCTRFDMSNIIPQKRIRLICIKKYK